MQRPFEFTGRVRSFKHAFRGIWLMLASQHNAWIHAAATLLVIGLGLYFRLSRYEWCWIVLACASVWTAEALNTAFEFLADVSTKEFHPVVSQAKDVAAGAVLLTVIGSLVIAIIIFLPHLSACLATEAK
jgi:diacylglycerol kinase (ATP)